MASEHAWVREHTQEYLSGGLSPGDRQRLDTHVKGCEPCRELLNEAAAFEAGLVELFADAAPGPGLEDRVIGALRKRGGLPFRQRYGPLSRAGLGAAAAVLLGVLGYVITGGDPASDAPLFTVSLKTTRAMATGQSPRRARRAQQGGEKGLQSPVAEAERKAAEIRGELARLTEADRDRGLNPPGRTYKAPLAHGPETADLEDFQKARGESLDMLADKPFKQRDMYDAIGGDRGPVLNPYFTLRSEAPPGNDAGYFRPEDALAKMVEKLEKNAKPSETGRSAPSKPRTSRKEQAQAQDAKPQPTDRKIIRTGEMEFEVEAFDATLDRIRKIVAEENGFVATVSSERLPNGKVRGVVVVRVPPGNLDRLVLKLRGIGELKSQAIRSSDVTKKYTDLNSRLRAARAMEERLLQIIKTGKGEVKDLLEAEKELGVWREKIELLEGEIRYYNNLISLSTLTLTLVEKDIRTPTAAHAFEQIRMSVETEDVEDAYTRARAEIEKLEAEKKARLVKAELKKHDAGQFSAFLHAEVAPDPGIVETLVARLRQLGHRVAQLGRDHTQTVEGGSGRPEGIRVEKKDTRIYLTLYNVTNIAPRETAHLDLAAGDVEKTYQAILKKVGDLQGRVVTSSLNREKQARTSATVHLEVPARAAGALEMFLRESGEVIRLVRTENRDTRNVTPAKVGFQVNVYAVNGVQPRETVTLRLAAKDVPKAYRDLQEQVLGWKGRIINASLNQAERDNVRASLDIEIPRARMKDLEERFSNLGAVYSQTSTRQPETSNSIDSKVRYRLDVFDVRQVPPRERAVLAVEVGDVDGAIQAVRKLVAGKKGRMITSDWTRRPNGQILGRLVFDVPLKEFPAVVAALKDTGDLRLAELSRDDKVPENELAIGRVEATIATPEAIVPPDEGLGARIRKGLGKSFSAVMWSLGLILVGLCFIGPWALLGFGGWRIFRWVQARKSP